MAEGFWGDIFGILAHIARFHVLNFIDVPSKKAI